MREASFVYSGRDNLIAMREAVRYKAYLMSLVARFAPAAGTWLDFGAGEGQYSLAFQRAGRQVVAVEADSALAAQNEAGGVLTYRDLHAVPNDSVAYVYSLNVLEHIDDDEAALAMLRRKLQPGGHLFVYVPAFQALYSSMDRLVGHHRRYSMGELLDVVSRAGFEPLRSQYVDSVGFVAAAIYKLLPDRGGVVTPQAVANYDRWVLPYSLALDSLFGRYVGKNVYVAARCRS